ncbi:MAG: hypothetical protein Q7R88_03325 [bacterium]|nr:hypothetical protein [bacterium]
MHRLAHGELVCSIDCEPRAKKSVPVRPPMAGFGSRLAHWVRQTASDVGLALRRAVPHQWL